MEITGRFFSKLFNHNSKPQKMSSIFKSNRYFTISDFYISHGQLLLRSNKNDNNLENIDIIFFDVRYIQLPTSFNGIAISKSSSSAELSLPQSIQDNLANSDIRVFTITATKEKFYVIAAFFKVFENQLEFNETSLGVSKPLGRHSEIIL
jgi:hypothetical protein